jgi:Na+-driven multidrug efflux pump
MRKLFKWLLIKGVVGALVTGLAIATILSLILWFILWPFVYLFKLISVKVDTKGRFISKRDWNDWIA